MWRAALASALCMALVAGCAGVAGDPELLEVFRNAENQREGHLSLEEITFEKRSLNIEQERIRVRLLIKNNAFISSACNISIQTFDMEGRMLDEYLIFNDMLPYEDQVRHRDDIYVKREHRERILKARYNYNCLKKEVLGREEGH
jgi:hypothetical protein